MKKHLTLVEDKVEYLGRLVDKAHFAAFVYRPDGSKRLVKSWDEYQESVSTGEWLAEPKAVKAKAK